MRRSFIAPAFPHLPVLLLLAAGLPPFALAADGGSTPNAPSFLHDVGAVLSKAGCNMGACHGNQNGKGGFQLSLRGQDPEFDYTNLVRQHGGRRVNRLDPEASLLLLKPTLRLAHEGGRRFEQGALEYEILRDWIAAGTPGPRADTPRLERLEVTPLEQVLIEPQWELQLAATAHFQDGSRRDVSRLAVYETSNLVAQVDPAGRVRADSPGEVTVTVRYLTEQQAVRLAFVPRREGFVWRRPAAHNYIDRLIDDKLAQLRINPSPLADDATFVRRAYLDALGVLPTAEEARRFVADRHPDKRRRLIDHLLARPEFADHWALKWSDVLRNEEKVLDSTGVAAFHAWIRDSIARSKPLDQFVRELVSASGSTYGNPPANYWRANRDPATRGETTARVFLGIRLQCAKCHNHPFDRWTQDDYYSWAALYARIDYKIVENERADKLDKNEFNGEQIVLFKEEGEMTHPGTGAPAPPRFLGSNNDRQLGDDSSEPGARLRQLAGWLTARDNLQFARAQANRIWYHLLGQGLVEPIDDFRLTNPAVNEPLLEALARDLLASGCDLRHMVRTIMNSRTYQASAEPNESNAGDERNFARAVVRRLPAEALLDAQCRVLDVPAEFAGYESGIRAGQIPGVRKVRRRGRGPAEGDRFLFTFGKPERLLACECERSEETTLNQAFLLLGGEGIHQRLTASTNRLARLAASPLDDAAVVDELYWTALSRPPSEAERQTAGKLLESAGDRLEGLQDLAWALLNSKEFVFRH